MIPTAQLKTADETLPITLFSSPKLAQQKLIQKLSELMDERHKKFFDYGALEGKTLVFYFKHNGIASEFSMKSQEFREKIIPIYKELNMKETLFFTNIQAKANYKPMDKVEVKAPYIDRAFGTFDIDVKDASVKEAFTKLRETIQNSHNQNKGGKSE